MLICVILVSSPLIWLIRQIEEEGFKKADTTRYSAMASAILNDVNIVRSLLNNEVVEESVLTGITASPVVTLITPDVAPTNMEEAVQQNNTKFNVTLKFISWTPHNPLVNIDGETYRVGDKVQGHTIKEIRKTEVVFLSPMGDTVIKYFYEYLDTPKRK